MSSKLLFSESLLFQWRDVLVGWLVWFYVLFKALEFVCLFGHRPVALGRVGDFVIK